MTQEECEEVWRRVAKLTSAPVSQADMFALPELRTLGGVHQIDGHVHEPVVVVGKESVVAGRGVRIDSFVKIEGGLGCVLGAYSHIPAFAYLNIGGGALWVGEHAAICNSVRIVTGSNTMQGWSMSAASPREMQVVDRSFVFVGARTFIGTGAIVLPGVRIGEGAVVGAGSIVAHDVEPWTVVMGTPARYLRHREMT